MSSAYGVLGITAETPVEAAEQAYRERRQEASQTPALDPAGAAQRDQRLAQIEWAWRTLSDPDARRAHDEWLASGGAPTASATPPPGAAPGWGPPAGGPGWGPPAGGPGWGPQGQGQWPGYQYPPQQAPRKSRTRLIVLLSVLGVLVLAIVAARMIANIAGGPEREDGRLVENGPIALEELRPGDCFNDPSNLGGDGEVVNVFTVDAVTCDEPHDNEVFAQVELAPREGEPFPGDDAMLQLAVEACRPEFEGFIGISYEATRLDMFVFQPNPQSWDAGDREVICAAYDPQGPVTGTLEGAGR